MELGDHGVGDRDCGRAPGAFAAAAPLRIGSDRQRPGAPAEHTMVALGQRDRPGRLNPPARDRQVGERTPGRLGEETPVVDLDLGQRRERVQIDPLAGGRPRIDLAGDPRREVPQPVDRTLAGKEKGSQPDGIEPPEGRPLERSVVQVEPVDIDPRSHYPSPDKARAAPGSSP